MTAGHGGFTADQGGLTAAPDGSPLPLLEIAGLGVRRGRETLISDLSFSVPRGSIHALVGANGAGKTTVLSAVLGLIPFTGRIVAHWMQSGRTTYVPQQFHVDRTLPVTVLDFLALTRQQLPVCLGISAAVRKRSTLLLERVGLRNFERKPLSVLSGGELRRVLLANALDPLPELLILDEPSGGLDDTAARWLDETLVSLKGELTIVMVSHDADQVGRIADGVTTIQRPRA